MTHRSADRLWLCAAQVVRRGEPIPPNKSGPIVVATRNDALDAIVDAVPPERRGDLVFLQNGMLEPWLEKRGLQDATQVQPCLFLPPTPPPIPPPLPCS